MMQAPKTYPRFVPAPAPAPTLGGTLGVIALAFGIGVLGAYALDLHSHTCDACGHTWRHLGAFNLGDPTSHTCTRCGTTQWWKDGVPHVFRSVLRTPPPDPFAARAQQQLALTDPSRFGGFR
jgi:hypothetical protein